MGTGDHEHFFTVEKFVVKELRERAEIETLIEDMFKLDVASGDRITDYDEIGPRVEILRIERLRDGDAEVAQEIGHGRISGGVGAGDVKSALFQHSGERRHGGTADADQMDVLWSRHTLKIIYHQGHEGSRRNANG